VKQPRQSLRGANIRKEMLQQARVMKHARDRVVAPSPDLRNSNPHPCLGTRHLSSDLLY
jgi:hypothetical protein